jgi:hypothetical protein
LISLAAALASGSSSSTLSQVEPGALGFLVVIGMGIMLFFLLRNMNKQFKKIGPKPEETDVPSAATEQAEQPAIRQTARVVRAIEAGPASNGTTSNGTTTSGTASDTVQTGDAKQDARAESATAKRK